jgi:ABC-2 type transport system ATP-binding protein
MAGHLSDNNRGDSHDAIVVSGLIKDFGSFRALNGLDLTVKKGEVHGFLGPNGAGKSTTIRILLGILRKTDGDVSVFGGDPWSDAVELHRRLAYVPGDVSLWPNLTGGEAIDLFAKLRGGVNRKRRDELVKLFELDPTKKSRTYSKGNRQKVALVAALASDVDLYIMDEPTSGLDPLMEAIFQDCVKELKRDGKTVLLSSHIMAEAEALCDRVTIIREGKAVQSGTMAELRHLTRMTIEVRTKQPLVGLAKLPGVYSVVDHSKNHAEFEVDNHAFDGVLRYLTQHNVTHLTSVPPSLENLFMRHYDDKVPANGRIEL